MRVLVTGGAGFIGSQTVLQLLKAGCDVVVVDNFSNSTYEVQDRIRRLTDKDFTVVEIDVTNYAALSSTFQRFKFDAVIHFAGLKSVSDSVMVPTEYYDVNVGGLLQLIKVMGEFNVKSLIFSSSATVYGKPLELPLREGSKCSAPTNPYGRSKVICESILEDLSASDSSWKIISLRYFNPVGADPSGLLGESPIGTPSNLFPFVSRVAAGVYDKLLVYGGDYDTPDGTGVRDYIHVVDLSAGHLRALEHLSRFDGHQVINLGAGRGYTVLEVISEFELVSGAKVPYDVVERRLGDVPVCFACTKRAKELLGWEAKMGLSQMCADAWTWQTNLIGGS